MIAIARLDTFKLSTLDSHFESKKAPLSTFRLIEVVTPEVTLAARVFSDGKNPSSFQAKNGSSTEQLKYRAKKGRASEVEQILRQQRFCVREARALTQENQKKHIPKCIT